MPHKVITRPPEQRKPVKLILLGDSAVGKSKLVERFLMQRYVPVQMSTYALTMFEYDFIDLETNEQVDCDIWDTAGQERFASMHPAYYHGAMCCILVFDATRKATYKNVEKWLSELRSFREHVPCILACNKIDEVPDAATKSFALAEKYNMPLFHVSAADGSNVVAMFEAFIALGLKYRNNPNPGDIVSQVMDLVNEDKGKEKVPS